MKKAVVLLTIFICLIVYIFYFDGKSTKRNNENLNNNIFFTGKVKSIKTSDNHAFGIILLTLDSTNIKKFNHMPLNSSIYPYRINGKSAELYTDIPDGLRIGDTIIVNSNKHKEYYKTKSNQKYEGVLQMVTDDINIDYVKGNTSFN